MLKHQNLFEYKYSEGVLFWKWLPTTENSNKEEMKECFQFYLNEVTSHFTLAIILDERDLRFTYAPDFQSWIDKQIIAKILDTDVRRIAVIQSRDFIVNLGVEQVFEEENASKFHVSFFETVSEAYSWIYEIPMLKQVG